jgi:hypothetical protein
MFWDCLRRLAHVRGTDTTKWGLGLLAAMKKKYIHVKGGFEFAERHLRLYGF